MRRRRWKFAELLLTTGALLFAGEQAAHAQACCVAPSTTGVGRLASYESVLGGVEARGAAMYGSFAPDGRLSGKSAGSHDVVLEQSLFATGRFLSRGQATLAVPFVETLRGSAGATSAGGGLGDIRLSARWDLVYAEQARPLPGVALIGGGSMPTGVAPESATNTLATDATGLGTTQGWAGAAFEEANGPWMLVASGLVSMRAERRVADHTASLPPRITAGLVGGHAWHSGFVLSLGASYSVEGPASLDGQRIPDTSRRALQLVLAVQAPLPNGARLVVSTFAHPPIAEVTAGETATTGVSLALVVPWN
jgi:hypothetical protein